MRGQRLQDIAAGLSVFLGGPLEGFEAIGRLQLITLLRCGLYPWSRVLDIGCGCLRGGYWLIQFLNPECYFGIEPNARMLDAGLKTLLDPATRAAKCPRFSNDANFDPSEFGQKFDFFLARSIWTHASRSQIETMLDSFLRFGADDSVFLTSYFPASDGGYLGDNWIGRSHESDIGGMVSHSLPWIQQTCSARNLQLMEFSVDRVRQPWLTIGKGAGLAPMQTYLREIASTS